MREYQCVDCHGHFEQHTGGSLRLRCPRCHGKDRTAYHRAYYLSRRPPLPDRDCENCGAQFTPRTKRSVKCPDCRVYVRIAPEDNLNERPLTEAQRRYLRAFTKWLRTPTDKNLDRRVSALNAMLEEAGVDAQSTNRA